MSVRLSERDLRVLAKCAASKWLTTSQLRRLYFRNVTADAACKSLRRLSAARYLVSFRENRMSEALHAVGLKGKRALCAKGLEVEFSRRPPRQIEHMVGINDVRVGLEAEPDRVAYFFAHWELGKLKWAYPVIPDGIFELKCPKRRRFALEFDRGTEPLEVFWRKLRSYGGSLPGFVLHAVVLVTETAERLRTVLRYLGNRAPPMRILGASVTDIRNAGIYAAVFRDACNPDQQARSLCESFGRATPEAE